MARINQGLKGVGGKFRGASKNNAQGRGGEGKGGERGKEEGEVKEFGSGVLAVT